MTHPIDSGHSEAYETHRVLWGWMNCVFSLIVFTYICESGAVQDDPRIGQTVQSTRYRELNTRLTPGLVLESCSCSLRRCANA